MLRMIQEFTEYWYQWCFCYRKFLTNYATKCQTSKCRIIHQHAAV